MTDKADIPFIIGRLRKAADDLERSGITCWDTTKAWERGASTANYDPEAGGNRWEEDDDGTVWPVPTDPTGDQALTPEQVKAHAAYKRHLDTAMSVTDDLILDIAGGTPRRLGRITDADKLATQVAAEGWCASCFRNGGKLVPQAMHPNGDVRYAGLCRWCKDFELEYGRRPPVQLLQRRHAGQRVTEQDVSEALNGRRHVVSTR